MKRLAALLVATFVFTAGCAGAALQQDCLARKNRADRAAAAAAEQLKPGWTAAEVRSALGEPDEIVTARGEGQYDIWKYYLLEDCTAHLGMTAPMTELFFFHGTLMQATTLPYPFK